MADQTTTPTTSPIGSTPVPGGKYTSEKLFLQLEPTEFNNHESDINNNGQIAFVSNGDSSFIYAKGVKVGGTDIKVEDLNLSNYATKNDVSTAIGALYVTDTAKSGQYVSAVSEENGKIKVTRANLPTVQTVSVDDSKNYVTIDGTKYTLGISNGVLSLSPYAKTEFNGDLTLSPIAYTNKASASTSKYVGTSYTISAGIDITSTSQTLTIHIKNTTGNKYKIAIKENIGNSYLRNDTTYSLTTHGDITQSIGSAYIMADVQTQTWSSKPVTWAAATPLELNTSGERTFTVYLTEEGKSTISQSVSQSNIQSKCTITAKVPVAAITSSSTAVSLKDINYSTSITIGTLTCNWKVASNTAPTFYVPSCLSKTPTIKDANNFDITSGFTVTTADKTICGCTTSFKIYTMNNKPTSDSKFTITL